jgi:hypothetical protein
MFQSPQPRSRGKPEAGFANAVNSAAVATLDTGQHAAALKTCGAD